MAELIGIESRRIVQPLFSQPALVAPVSDRSTTANTPDVSQLGDQQVNLAVPLIFALLAGATRFFLPDTYSRYQVLAFAAVAVLVELIIHCDDGPRMQAASYLANVLSAFAAIVFVKWQLEGISLGHWARLLAAFI